MTRLALLELLHVISKERKTLLWKTGKKTVKPSLSFLVNLTVTKLRRGATTVDECCQIGDERFDSKRLSNTICYEDKIMIRIHKTIQGINRK